MQHDKSDCLLRKYEHLIENWYASTDSVKRR